MSASPPPGSRSALRLASGVATCIAIGYALDLTLPFLAAALAVFLLAMVNQPLPLKAGAGLVLIVLIMTGSGLLLVPMLRHYPLSAVLLIGLSLFLVFRYGLRGGNNLVSVFAVIGLTVISSAGTVSIALAATLVGALVKATCVAVLVHTACHRIFPEPADRPGSAAGGGRAARK